MINISHDKTITLYMSKLSLRCDIGIFIRVSHPFICLTSPIKSTFKPFEDLYKCMSSKIAILTVSTIKISDQTGGSVICNLILFTLKQRGKQTSISQTVDRLISFSSKHSSPVIFCILLPAGRCRSCRNEFLDWRNN